MVGLRWWNYINDEGQSEWVFEARNGNSQHLLSPSEVRIFWGSLVIAPAMWTIFFITALMGFRFQWLVLVVIGLVLSSSNLMGYLRCRLGHGNKDSNVTSSFMSGLANSYLKTRLLSDVSNFFSSRSGSSTTQGQSNVI